VYKSQDLPGVMSWTSP